MSEDLPQSTIASGSTSTEAHQANSAQALGLSIHDYVVRRFREIGLGEIEIHRGETRLLPEILKSNEFIGGVVCGKSTAGHIMLVATSRRVLVIDAKPIYNSIEDITYRVVAGVSLRHSRLMQRLTLHTRLGDFTVQTTNAIVAHSFKEYIDWRCIEQTGGDI